MSHKQFDLFTSSFFFSFFFSPVNTRLASLWFHCISCCIVQGYRGISSVWYVHVHVQCTGHKTESHWHHRSIKKIQTWFGQANVSNSWTLLRQKAASTRLLSVRPAMPRLALVQFSGDFNLHLRLFTLLYMKLHRFVNIYHVRSVSSSPDFCDPEPCGV